MNVLKALLGTIGIFTVATFLTWIGTKGIWGAITLSILVFIAIFVAILAKLSC